MQEIEGIVIRNTKFRDNDMMVNVLTCNGYVSFLAKGVLKLQSKNSPSVQLMNKSLFQIMKCKEGNSLKTGLLIRNIYNGDQNLEKLLCINVLTEITEKLIITKEDAINIYPILDLIQGKLPMNDINCLDLTLRYVCQLLKIIGYGLTVDKCQKCHQTGKIKGFSYKNGLFTCSSCFSPLNDISCSSQLICLLKSCFDSVDCSGNLTFSKETYKEAFNLLEKFIEYNLNINLISIKMIESI